MKKLDWRNKEEWLSSIPKYAGDIIDDEFLVKIKWDNHDDVSRLLDGNIVKSFKDALINIIAMQKHSMHVDLLM